MIWKSLYKFLNNVKLHNKFLIMYLFCVLIPLFITDAIIFSNIYTKEHNNRIHEGGIIFESDIDHLKTSLFKVQVAFADEYGRERFEGIDALSYSKRGSVASLIVRGDRAETEAKITEMHPVLFEILPLSLEEVFVYEMGQRGYEFSEVLKQEVQ